MSALHQARHLRALAEQADKPPAGGGGEGPAGRALDLVSIGLLLNRSVHALSDDDARLMRDTAHRAGASPQLLAAAQRLRDKRRAEDVTVVETTPPKCKCSHSRWRHLAERDACRRPGCGCTTYRAGDAK